MITSRASLSLSRLASRQIGRCKETGLQSQRNNCSFKSSTIHLRPILSPSIFAYSRSFASSSRLQLPAAIKDPDHPSDIYFHQLPGSSRYAITYLEKPPSSPDSASIIAFVTPPKDNKEEIYELICQQPDLVEANTAFLDLMHDTLKNECVPEDGMLEYEAYLRKDGWAHLNDQRLQLMPGRISTPENIIASVAFTDEKIRPESYEANGTYRVVTGEEGFMQLRPNWLMFLKKRCEQVN